MVKSKNIIHIYGASGSGTSTLGRKICKEHWNSVILDGSVPTEEIKRMIGESYDLTK